MTGTREYNYEIAARLAAHLRQPPRKRGRFAATAAAAATDASAGAQGRLIHAVPPAGHGRLAARDPCRSRLLDTALPVQAPSAATRPRRHSARTARAVAAHGGLAGCRHAGHRRAHGRMSRRRDDAPPDPLGTPDANLRASGSRPDPRPIGLHARPGCAAVEILPRRRGDSALLTPQA